MKKVLQLIPIILSITFLLSACKKNSSEEQYTETVHPVIPDLSTQINASVDGFITDENGNAAEGALIKAGTLSTLTDAYGYFKLSNASFAKDAGYIQVTKAGYFAGYRTFLPRDGKQTFIRLQLILKTTIGTIDASIGGTVSTTDAASVIIPANAVVIASSNVAYTGMVNVAIQWLNPDDMAPTSLTMPGDLRGIDSAGYLNTLTTYGMLAVELTGSTGELLQIASGQKASLTFPIPSSLQGSAPASIPLWYFNENNGLWKEDGTAIKNGANYNGDVSHFTYWNCDISSSTTSFIAQLIDLSLNPIVNTAVSISIPGLPNSTRTGYTDANGEVYGGIPANCNLIVSVSGTCSPSVYTQNVTSTNAPVDLGSVRIDVQLYEAEFKGSVVKCNASPVTDGYVIIASGLANQVAEIENGIFDVHALICTGSNAVLIAYDRETSQQSTIQNFPLTTGVNDFGSISACTTAAAETIVYTLDGGPPVTLALPQHLFNGNFDFGNSITTINAIDLLNGSVTAFNLTFAGPDAPGDYVVGSNLILNQVAYTFAGPYQITVTNYGLIGELITASRPISYIQDGSGNLHPFSCTINIIRDL